MITDTGQPHDWPPNNQPDQPMPQHSWGSSIGPISPRPEPVKRSDDSVSPKRPVKPRQAAPPASVVPPSAPTPLPAVKPAAPVVPVARHPPPRPAPALPPQHLGGDAQPQSQQRPNTVPNDKNKKLDANTKYRTYTPASGSNDPMPKAKPVQPSQPTLPLAEPGGESDDSGELVPDRPADPPSEAEADETRYYSSDEVDLVFDEKDWVYYTEDQKLCANTASFSMPRYMDGAPVDVKSATSKVRHGSTRCTRPKKRDKSDTQEDYTLITEDKAHQLTFFYLSQSQKAQRKEATATERRQLKKQFDEA